jgi:hypothetical protein
MTTPRGVVVCPIGEKRIHALGLIDLSAKSFGIAIFWVFKDVPE